MIDLRKGDCLEEMRKIPDKSVNLVLIDPPYNIKKDKKWDNRKTNDYISFMGEVFTEISRVLVDNGSLYFFHNDLPLIAQLMEWMRQKSDLEYNSFIVCYKENFRKFIWSNPKRENGNNLRSWFNICEYCLCYVKRSLPDLHSNPKAFRPVKDYLLGEYEKLGMSVNELIELTPKYLGRRVTTIGHYFRDSQFIIPSKDVYENFLQKIRGGVFQKPFSELRDEYNDMLIKYSECENGYGGYKPVHNLDAEHNNIWNMKRDKGENYHPCQKPIDILERIIRCSTNPGMVVLDCFMGSGSTGVACVNTGRSFVGIEMDDHYFDVAKNRIEEAEAKAESASDTTGAFLL